MFRASVPTPATRGNRQTQRFGTAVQTDPESRGPDSGEGGGFRGEFNASALRPASAGQHDRLGPAVQRRGRRVGYPGGESLMRRSGFEIA
jgi:hypothetical protein